MHFELFNVEICRVHNEDISKIYFYITYNISLESILLLLLIFFFVQPLFFFYAWGKLMRMSFFYQYICLVIGVEDTSSIDTTTFMETSGCTLSPGHQNLPVVLSSRNSTLASELAPEDGDSSGTGMIQLTML